MAVHSVLSNLVAPIETPLAIYCQIDCPTLIPTQVNWHKTNRPQTKTWSPGKWNTNVEHNGTHFNIKSRGHCIEEPLPVPMGKWNSWLTQPWFLIKAMDQLLGVIASPSWLSLSQGIAASIIQAHWRLWPFQSVQYLKIFQLRSTIVLRQIDLIKNCFI